MDATGVAFGRLDSTRTPGLHIGDWHAACLPARGCGLLSLLSAEGDNNRFPYKDDAHVEKWVIDSLEVESEHSPLKAPRSADNRERSHVAVRPDRTSASGVEQRAMLVACGVETAHRVATGCHVGLDGG